MLELRGKILFVLFFLFAMGVVLISANQTDNYTPAIGIYDGEGTWDIGKAALKNFIEQEEMEWVLLSAEDINESPSLSSKIDLLWVPGGWAWSYTQDINYYGEENIRKFLRNGGKLIGTCAGQYYVADLIIWEEEKIEYPLKLFDGVVKGPIDEIIPWPGFKNTALILNAEHPINYGFYEPLTMVYFGGGDIWPNKDVDLKIIAYYDATESIAIGTFEYGDGFILLIGTHPEMGLTTYDTWNLEGGEKAQWNWLSSAVNWLIDQ